MHWNLPPEDDHMREIARMALRCCPQRVTLECLGEVVVLSAAEYARLVGAPPEVGTSAEPERDAGSASTQDTQLSAAPKPLAERKWVWEWDEEAQAYVLPWAKDVDPAEQPGLEFLNFMQNSPLAEMLRTGEITEEEWDEAMRSSRG